MILDRPGPRNGKVKLEFACTLNDRDTGTALPGRLRVIFTIWHLLHLFKITTLIWLI